MNYLLDTNILVVYARATGLSLKIEQDLGLFREDNDLVISVVSVGEVKSIAQRNKWGKRKIDTLEKLLSRFLVADRYPRLSFYDCS